MRIQFIQMMYQKYRLSETALSMKLKLSVHEGDIVLDPKSHYMYTLTAYY